MDIGRFKRILSDISRFPPVRKYKIEKIKKSIRNGTYEDEEKLKIAVSRLLKKIESSP